MSKSSFLQQYQDALQSLNSLFPSTFVLSQFIASTALVQVPSPLAWIAPRIRPAAFWLPLTLPLPLIPAATRMNFANAKMIMSFPYLKPSMASNKCWNSPALSGLISAHLYRVICHHSPHTSSTPLVPCTQFPECIMLVPISPSY